MSEFVRENRFIVLKRTDVQKYLPLESRQILNEVCEEVAERRCADGKRPKNFVCIADDWPMYESVWKMVEEYATGKCKEEPPFTLSGFIEQVKLFNKWMDDHKQSYGLVKVSLDPGEKISEIQKRINDQIPSLIAAGIEFEYGPLPSGNPGVLITAHPSKKGNAEQITRSPLSIKINEWAELSKNCKDFDFELIEVEDGAAGVRIISKLTKNPGCTRSHPHEDMSAECEAKTEIAESNFEAATKSRVMEAFQVPDNSGLSGRNPTVAILDEIGKAAPKQVGGTHYEVMAMDPLQLWLSSSMPAAEAEVLKQVSRYERKGGRQDLEKAINYIERIRCHVDAQGTPGVWLGNDALLGRYLFSNEFDQRQRAVITNLWLWLRTGDMYFLNLCETIIRELINVKYEKKTDPIYRDALYIIKDRVEHIERYLGRMLAYNIKPVNFANCFSATESITRSVATIEKKLLEDE